MCGIGFWYHKNGVDSSVFQRYMHRIIHRGPDYQGQKSLSKSVIIGNNRLAIIDNNPRSNQPFELEDLSISFNGAIYNYKKLQQDLIHLGHEFVTNSDTEVILHAFKEYGPACVKLFEGMWSFVIYDTTNNKVFASRDRLGIKPLYYLSSDNEFLIASEVKQFKEIPDIEWKINANKVRNYLSSEGFTNQDNETFIKGIFQLEPGHNLEYNTETGQFIKLQYYDFKTENKSTSNKAIINSIRSSVEKRLIGDHESGVMFSGGLDSSIISYHVLQKKKNLRSYSFIEARDKSMDESEYIKAFLQEFPHENNQTVFPKEISRLIEKCIYYQDEPPASLSTIAQFMMYKLAASRGERLMLSGQGADELFGGYPRFMSFIKPSQWFRNKKEFLRTVILYVKQYFSRKQSALAIFVNKPKKMVFQDSIEYTNFLVQQNGLRDLLHYEDRNSMASGIETRLPFLDTEILTLTKEMNDIIKFTDARRKGILFHLYKDTLPKSIIERRSKTAFDTPEELLLNNDFFDVEHEFEKLKKVFPSLDWNPSFDLAKHGSLFLKWQVYFLNVWLKEFFNKN